jgi:cytoskeletal protein RodZ
MAPVDQPFKGFARLLAAVAILSMATATLRLKLDTWRKTHSDSPSSATAVRPPKATSPFAVGDFPSPAIASVQVMPSPSEATSPSPVGESPSAAVAAIAVVPPRPQPTSQSTVDDLAPPIIAATAKTSRPPELATAIDTIAIAKRPHKTTMPETTATREAADLSSSTAAAARAKALVEQSVGIPNARILEPIIAKGADDGSSVNHAKRPRYETEVIVEIPRGSGSPIQRRYRLTLQYVGGGEWQVKGMQFATRY